MALKKKKKGVTTYIPITFLMTIIGFLFTVFTIVLLPMITDMGSPFKDENSNVKNTYYAGSDIVGYVFVNIFFAMVVINFSMTSFTRAGSVPAMFPWDPDAPDPRSGGSLSFQNPVNRGIERKLDGRTRFCRICGKYKPDRAHHCRMCGECVLELDHHCPWVRNCVGYFNHKYFFLLLLYGCMALDSFCVVLGPYFVQSCKSLNDALDVFVIFGWILGLMLACVLNPFFFFHVWLLKKSYTTIEFCEKRNAAEQKRTATGKKVREIYSRSAFNLGFFRNAQHLLGPNPLFWFLPTRYGMPAGPTAGCVFEVDESHELFKGLKSSGSTKRTSSNSDFSTPISSMPEAGNISQQQVYASCKHV